MPGLMRTTGLPAMTLPPVLHYTERRRRQQQKYVFCRRLARIAIRSLYQELTLYPKPGLVSLVDNGSHDDMDASTFMRSLFALRHYFFRIAEAGMAAAPFSELRQLGLEAEQRMLHATRGVNTHRGAIFCLGMLCAAIAYCHSQEMPMSPPAIRAALLIQWGDSLTAHSTPAGGRDSHGLRVAASHAVGGAREEGAMGFPSVFEIALPQLQKTRDAGRNSRCAMVDALFALMAHISDTNVYHRGGSAGATVVRDRSRAFLACGGSGDDAWMTRAQATHCEFVRLRLSPGGAADLLAAACLIQSVCVAGTAV